MDPTLIRDRRQAAEQGDCCEEVVEMLVLCRKLGEQIVIDGRIVVCVVKIRRGRVQLAIEAPPEVTVVRRELLHTISEEAPKSAAVAQKEHVQP